MVQRRPQKNSYTGVASVDASNFIPIIEEDGYQSLRDAHDRGEVIRIVFDGPTAVGTWVIG